MKNYQFCFSFSVLFIPHFRAWCGFNIFFFFYYVNIKSKSCQNKSNHVPLSFSLLPWSFIYMQHMYRLMQSYSQLSGWPFYRQNMKVIFCDVKRVSWWIKKEKSIKPMNVIPVWEPRHPRDTSICSTQQKETLGKKINIRKDQYHGILWLSFSFTGTTSHLWLCVNVCVVSKLLSVYYKMTFTFLLTTFPDTHRCSFSACVSSAIEAVSQITHSQSHYFLTVSITITQCHIASELNTTDI